MLDADELRKNIAANISRLRESKGWLQDDLARRVGITRIHLSRIENAHMAPSIALLYTFADVFAVSADALRQTAEKLSRSA